jgi:hypothetical protein
VSSVMGTPNYTDYCGCSWMFDYVGRKKREVELENPVFLNMTSSWNRVANVADGSRLKEVR